VKAKGASHIAKAIVLVLEQALPAKEEIQERWKDLLFHVGKSVLGCKKNMNVVAQCQWFRSDILIDLYPRKLI
jgi:hypothetical protein